LNRLAEITAVATALPALVLSGLVLYHWFPEAFKALRRGRDAADWLVLGVAVSFLGMLLSTLYWAAYWLARFLGSPAQSVLLEHGNLFNLFTRQGAIIVAAWCHLKAYHMFNREGGGADPTWHLKWTMAVTALIVLGITMLGGLANG
jgi:hypothetical protein